MSRFAEALRRVQLEHDREIAKLRCDIDRLQRDGEQRAVTYGTPTDAPASVLLRVIGKPTKCREQSEKSEPLAKPASLDTSRSFDVSRNEVLRSSPGGTARRSEVSESESKTSPKAPPAISPPPSPRLEFTPIWQGESQDVRPSEQTMALTSSTSMAHNATLVTIPGGDISMTMEEENTGIVSRAPASQHTVRLSKMEILSQATFELRAVWNMTLSDISGTEHRMQTLIAKNRLDDNGFKGFTNSTLEELRKAFHLGRHGTSGSTDMIQEARDCHCLLIRPGSRPKLYWDGFAMLALIFDMLWLPLQVFSPTQTQFISIMQWATLIIWTWDMFMSLITGYSTKEGVVVMKFRRIAKRYFKTWFFCDILIVGLDWALMIKNISDDGAPSKGGAASARIVKIMRLFRMLRTLRFLRLLKLREFFYSIQQKLDSEWASIVYSMVFNVVLILMINHGLGCLWFFLGKSEDAGWVNSTDVIDQSMKWQYFTSLHWALAQFTPAGSEIQPKTADERIFAVGMLVFGLLLSSAFISSVTAGVTRLRNLQEVRSQQRYTLRRYLKENHISSGLAVRVNRYIDIIEQVRKQKTDASDVKLLQLLSVPLRIQLQTEICAPRLISHEVFHRYNLKSTAAMAQLCFEAVKTGFLSKHDDLFTAFSEAHSMYMMTQGLMVYKRITDSDLLLPAKCRIEEGQVLSEPTLWVSWIHRGTMSALTLATTMDVRADVFGTVTRKQPEVYVEMRRYACEYVNRMTSWSAEHGLVFDVDMEVMTDSVSVGPLRYDSDAREVIQSEIMEMEMMDAEMRDAKRERSA